MVESPRVEKLRARVGYPRYAFESLTTEELSAIAVKDLAHNMAETLIGFMDIKTYRNYERDVIEVQADLRVVPPSFRF